MFDPELNDYAKMSGYLLMVAGLGWIIHECFEEGKALGIGSSKGSKNLNVSGQNKGIDFGKYMDKTPKFEREYGRGKGKEQQPIMQEMGAYAPPSISVEYKNEDNV
jgi:hypothetical protein